MTITVTEYDLSTGVATGLVMTFSTRSGPLYTARLKDGRATLGKLKRVVYPHGPDGTIVWIADKKLREPR